MSWDLFIQHLPASAITVDDVPDDFSPLPLGSRAEVVSAIVTVFPEADTSDPSWVTFETPMYSIVFATTAEEPVTAMTLHVRGDESVVPGIAALVEKLGARAVDSWTGEFFDPVTAVESIRRWRLYIEESSS
jgi:hypothetical protein